MARQPKSPASKQSFLKMFLSTLGPGLITGAADDDPSGIATYSQIGAQFGYGLLWTMLFSFPFMSAIQEISGRIGRVTGHGIAGVTRRYYPRWLLYSTVLLLFTANTINIGADLGAMAAALQLLIGGSLYPYVLGFGLLCLVSETFIPYKKYVYYLKWLTLVLFAYVVTAFTVKVPWGDVLKNVFIPSARWSSETFTALTAVLGTTISPYLFFWQASEEAEEVQIRPKEHPLKSRPEEAPFQLSRIRIDTYVGMAFSNIVAFFIILTSAVTLHAHGTREVHTAAEAAAALKPLAGPNAFLLFALGIIGTGLLTVPVLGGSAAYAVGEALHVPVGLQRPPKRVKRFYAILALSVLLGMALNFFHMDPIQGLYWAAILNGVVSAPVIAVMMLLSDNPKVMGTFTLPRYLRWMGWATMGIMLAATIGMVVTYK